MNAEEDGFADRTKRIQEIAKSICCLFEEQDVCDEEAVDAMGVVCTFIMVGCETRGRAKVVFDTLTDSICRTMNKIEESGMSPWDRGTPN